MFKKNTFKIFFRKQLANATGLITTLAGLLVLIGWQFGSYTLKTFALGGVTMKVNTAISFLLSGLALILLQRTKFRTNNVLVRLFAIVIVSLGFLTLYQYVFAINFGIDEFLFREAERAVATVNPGRMAPNTSLNFVLLGLVLFAFSFQKFKINFSLMFPLIIAFCVSVIGLLGYITDFTELAGLPAYTKMAINTSVTFIILCSGIFFTIYKDQKAPILIEHKLFAGLTIAGSLIVFVSIISITSIQSLISSSDLVEHTQQVKEELGLAKSEVYEMKASGLGFLISGDEVYLKQWNQAKENIPKTVNNLSELTRDNPKQQALLISLNQLVKERLDFSNMLINTYKTKGQEAAIELFATQRGKKITDEINKIISQMTTEENRLLTERNINESNQANRTELIIILSVIVQVFLLTFIFVFVKQDLSGRQKAEGFLQESEVKFKNVFENSPIGKSLTTIDGKLRVNKEFCNIVGYSEEELLKLHWKEITHPDDIDESQRVVSSLLAGEKDHARYQKRYIHKSGKIVWTDISTFLQRDKNGKPLHFITSINDITGLKRYEEALLQLNEELEDRVKERTAEVANALQLNESILESAGDGIYGLDLEGNTTFLNQAAANLLGNLKEDLIGKEMHANHHHHKPDGSEYPREECPIYYAFKDGSTHTVTNEVFWRKDGTPFFVEYTATPIYKEGKINGAVVVFKDITERKLAEQQLIQSAKRIERLNRVYVVLSNVNQLIVRERNEQKLFEEACRIAVNDGKFRMALIGLVDEENAKVNFVAKDGYANNYFDRINIDLKDKMRNDGPTGTAIKTQKHFIINNIDTDERMKPWREAALNNNYRSCASFPLNVFGKVYGAFTLFSDSSDFFDEEEIKLLDEMAMDISFAIETGVVENQKIVAEENLRESELRFRSVWEKGTDGMRITNEEGNVVLVNDAYCKMVEKPLEEIEGKPMSVVFVEANQAEALRKHQERFHSRSISHHLEKDIVLWNGRRISLELSNTLLEIPHQPTLVLSVFRNITERKQAQQELKNKDLLLSGIAKATSGLLSNYNYQTALQDSLGIMGKAANVDRVYIFENYYDEKTKLWYSNQRFEWTSETTEPQIDNTELQNVPFSGIESFIEPLKNDKPFLGIVNKLPDKNTKEILQSQDIQSILVFPIFINQVFWGFVGFDECKYERTWTESEFSILQSYSSAISSALDRNYRTQELQVAKEKAEEMSRLKSSFLANMSHELRTPLVGIIGYADLLRNDSMDDELKKIGEIIYLGGLRLSETLNLILDLSKFESEKLDFQYGQVDLVSEMEQIIDSFKETARKKGLYLKTILSHPSIFINSDGRAYRSIINNLINNAIKYTIKGGITADISLQDDIVEIRVTDTGIGIAKEDHQIIFDEFRQVSEGYSRNFEGSGLGLSITKKLVEKFGGEISVDSEPGKGSTFTVKLPVKSAEERTANKTVIEKAIPKVLAKQKSVKPLALLVDDDPIVFQMMKRYISEYAELDTTADAKFAIKMLLRKKYDLIFMDINLKQGLDGKQATQAIRILRGYESIPIIATTAYAMVGDKEEFLAAGCSHYLSKPFNQQDIRKLLEEIFSSS